MDQNQAQAAIKAVYEAALRPETWPDALDRICSAVGSTGAVAQMVGANGHSLHASRSYLDTIHDYVEGNWQELNHRMTRGLAMTNAGHRGFLTEYQMFTPDELARDPFQQEFAPRHGMEAEAGIVLASHTNSMFVLTVPRGARAGSYSADELAAMNLLAMRLSDACSFALRMKLIAATDMMETLSGRTGALALLTPRGRVLQMTSLFERLLANSCLVWRAGAIRARNREEDRALQALILRAGLWTPESSEPLKSVVLGRGSDHPLIARCLPVSGAARDFLGLARTVLAIDEAKPPRRRGAVPVFRAAFGLTAAEARLAERVGCGETLREAACAEQITYETARTRLKTVFRKTGTSRQSELSLLTAQIT